MDMLDYRCTSLSNAMWVARLKTGHDDGNIRATRILECRNEIYPLGSGYLSFVLLGTALVTRFNPLSSGKPANPDRSPLPAIAAPLQLAIIT